MEVVVEEKSDLVKFEEYLEILKYYHDYESKCVNKIDLNKNINESYNYLKNEYDGDTLNMLSLIDTYYKFHNESDLFHEALNKVNLHICDDNIVSIYKKYRKRDVPFDIRSVFYFDTKLDYENKLIINDYNILLSTQKNILNRSNIYILDSLVHELNHVKSAVNDSGKFINDSTHSTRIGIMFINKNKNNNVYKRNKIINEFYNEFFSTLIVNEIIKYKNYNIDNIEIRNYLSTIMNDTNKNVFSNNSYPMVKITCYPLLENIELTNLVKDIYNYGNIFRLDNYMYNNGINFYNLSNEIDNLCNKEIYYDEYKDIKDNVNKIGYQKLK